MPHLQRLDRFMAISIRTEEKELVIGGSWVVLDTPEDVIATINLGKAGDITARGTVNCIYFPDDAAARSFLDKLNTESSKIRKQLEKDREGLPGSIFKDFNARSIKRKR